MSKEGRRQRSFRSQLALQRYLRSEAEVRDGWRLPSDSSSPWPAAVR